MTAVVTGCDKKLRVVIFPEAGEGGGGRQIAEKRDPLAQLRLEIRERVVVAAATQLRDLRAQLFAFRPVLLAPQLGIEAVVDVGKKFPLIFAQHLRGHRIKTRDRVAPCGGELTVGGGELGVAAGGELARGLRGAAIKRGVGGGRRRKKRRRKPVVRALRAAEVLQRRSQESEAVN